MHLRSRCVQVKITMRSGQIDTNVTDRENLERDLSENRYSLFRLPI
jgi:hypothetical protein